MYDSFPYIEPCCYQIHLTDLFKVAETRGFVNFFSYSDVSPKVLLDWFALKVPMSDTTIVLIDMKQRTAEILASLLKKEYYDSKTGEHGTYIRHLNVITQGEDKAVTDWLKAQCPDRVTVASDKAVAFRCLTMRRGHSAYALQGTLYQQTNTGALQMFTLMYGKNAVNEIHRVLDSIVKLKLKN